MLFHFLLPCLLALALVDEVEEVVEEEEVRLDGDLCNLTTVGRRWGHAIDIKSKKKVDRQKRAGITRRVRDAPFKDTAVQTEFVQIGNICRPEWREASIRDGRWILPFLVSKNVKKGEEVYQVHPGGVPPLVVVLKGDLEARWVEEMV